MKCYGLKTIILGDSGVGKTTLLYKFFTGVFGHENQSSTVGVNFISKYVKYSDFENSVKLQIWDTAGQERFRSIIRSYYHNICGCVIVYDVTNRTSFENSVYWLNEVRRNNPNVKIVLVGTKIDLFDKREIDYIEGEKISKRYDMFFFEISSKGCVDHVFEKLVKIILEDFVSEENIESKRGISLSEKNDDSESKKRQSLHLCRKCY